MVYLMGVVSRDGVSMGQLRSLLISPNLSLTAWSWQTISDDVSEGEEDWGELG